MPAAPGVGEGMMTNFADPNEYVVEGRGVRVFHRLFQRQALGAGQYYLMTIVDKDGEPLMGPTPIA